MLKILMNTFLSQEKYQDLINATFSNFSMNKYSFFKVRAILILLSLLAELIFLFQIS